MSQAVIVNIEVEGVDDSIVKEVMDDLGWDGQVVDNIDGTVYFEGSGNICIGTSEWKQEDLIREAFNKKMGKEIEVDIHWS